MIGMLTGTILERYPDRIVLDVSGVGYALRISLSTYYALAGLAGPTCGLHVHTHVREDAIQLYGFATRAERGAFEQLIGISGVGPRMALAILSGIGVDDLRRAVSGKDRRTLEKIPGVGRKTAERLLLELQDKLLHLPESSAARTTPTTPVDGRTSDDARSALVNLGYAAQAAERAVSGAVGDLGGEAALEEVLKAALARLVR